MDILVKAVQLILSLSILVLVHELGHFVFARIFKVRVEKFYLFFDIKYHLFKFKPKNSDTEYGIGWLPLGGYCKISGMIDESMDTEQMNQEPQSYEFRSKPAWQRLLIMVGGALFNVILAFLIYSSTLMAWGDSYLANKDAVSGIACDSIALEMGFRNGDKIVWLDGKPVEKFYDLQKNILLYTPKVISVEREGNFIDIEIDYDKYISYFARTRMFEPLMPFIIHEIPDTSINKASGLQKGDEVIGINDLQMNDFMQIKNVLPQHKGEKIQLTTLRGKDTLNITAQVSEDGLLQILLLPPSEYFNETKIKYNPISAIPAGVKKASTRLKDQLYELKLMVTPKTETYKQVGSFISIGNIYDSSWNWQRFWDITALLSIMLAVLNLLPIPALDGGHVMFLLYEVITRRKPSDKFMGYAQMVGMVILLFIMIYALGNDIFRHIIK